MARKPTVSYWPTRKAYGCWWKGTQHILAKGEKDEPDGPTYLRALDEFRKVMERTNLGQQDGRAGLRVLAEAWMSEKATKVAESTLEIRQHLLRPFIARYGDCWVDQLTIHQIEAFVASMRRPRAVRGVQKDGAVSACPAQARTVSWGDATARMFLTSLHAVIRWGIRRRFITQDPIPDMELPTARTRARERIVQPAEHAAVLASLKTPRTQPLRRAIIALENTGARPSELANARVRDWNDKLGAIVYYGDDKRAEWEFSHKNAGKGKDRFIYFSGPALDMVRAAVAGKRHEELIFPNSKGTQYNAHSLHLAVSKCGRKLGYRHLVPYAYRHTFATRWLEAGKSIDVLAALLGNSAATIRKHYSHLCQSHDVLRSALEEFRRTTS